MGRWLDANILALGREMRLSYLPPLMVYAAAGISGLTSIVGTFYVKERLGLSAEFLAALGFWMMLPWALKMPLGHLVDLMWRWKSLLVYMGAGLITLSLLIMIGLAWASGGHAGGCDRGSVVRHCLACSPQWATCFRMWWPMR